MVLEILIATVEERFDRIGSMLLPEREDVRYLVSCQFSSLHQPVVPESLSERKDVRVLFLEGRGLSNNRNNTLLHAQGDVLLIADDDEQFDSDGLTSILQVYQEHPDVDIALFKVDGMSKYYPERSFRFEKKDFRGAYYTASVEMTLRRSTTGSLRFNNHFGLGSDFLSAGEEQIFVYDALDAGLRVQWFPVKIASTTPITTGDRYLEDICVQRSKGATFCYLFGVWSAYMLCLKEVLYHLIYHRVNPISLFRHLNSGIRYVVRLRNSSN